MPAATYFVSYVDERHETDHLTSQVMDAQSCKMKILLHGPKPPNKILPQEKNKC